MRCCSRISPELEFRYTDSDERVGALSSTGPLGFDLEGPFLFRVVLLLLGLLCFLLGVAQRLQRRVRVVADPTVQIGGVLFRDGDRGTARTPSSIPASW